MKKFGIVKLKKNWMPIILGIKIRYTGEPSIPHKYIYHFKYIYPPFPPKNNLTRIPALPPQRKKPKHIQLQHVMLFS